MIANDFNAWALERGSRENNAKGRSLLEVQLNIVRANAGYISPFRKRVNLAFANPELGRSMCGHIMGPTTIEVTRKLFSKCGEI